MLLNENEIFDIYRRFVIPKYNNTEKYNNLPLEFNNKNWKWENKDFPRVISLIEFKEFMEVNNNPKFENVLSFNGQNDPEYEYLNYTNIINFNYTDNPIKYDLHNLDIDKKDFDFFMSNQTLEHLYDPCLVLRNIYDHMKPGGIVYMNLPSMNMPHSTPLHYYTGFTPVGLGCIFKQAGFEILDIGFWGNSNYYDFVLNKGIWPDYRQMTNYSYEKDKEAITWIFARKPINSI
jgi:SAM-dependent methyltransferase